MFKVFTLAIKINVNTMEQKNIGISQRKTALIAGFGLLAMAIIAVFANFGVIENLVVTGDAAATADNLTDSKALFAGGIAGFIVVFLLDLLVAWMLFKFFKNLSKGLSTAMAWCRVVYAGFFGFSITYLVTTLKDLGAEGITNDIIMESITSFSNVWSVGYIFFGIHLILLAYLAIKSGHIAKWIGVLLAIAGSGYLVDSVGGLIISDYNLEIGLYTFIGELVFMFWLLFKGGKEKQLGVSS
jgi:hypothetical protein